jgi:iron complex outermembrane receptor protein
MKKLPIRKAGKVIAIAMILSTPLGNLYAADHNAGQEFIYINMPAQPLAAAINAWAKQAGMKITVAHALLDGKQAPSVSGNLSFRESLDRILAGSGLQANIERDQVVIAQQNANAMLLEEVTVVANTDSSALSAPYAGGHLARGGSLGVLGNVSVMNTPFNTTNYTSELIMDQQARSVADVVVNDASVRAVTAPGGFSDQFLIRGFVVNNEDTGINGLYGLTSSTRIPLEMVERVQVLKGPGSLVNGIPPSGSIGGAINLVTKRAGDEPLTRLTTSYLSNAQLGAHIDVARRFGENKEWGVRVNGLKRAGEGTIDNGNQNTGLATLGLDYKGNALRWSLDAIVQDDSVREFRPQTSIAANATQVPAAPDARSNFYPGTKLDYKNRSVLSNAEYDVNENIMLYGGLGYTDYSYEQTFPSAVGGVRANGDFNVRNGYYDFYSKTAVTNAGARIRFATGKVGHTLGLAANRSSQETGFFYTTSAGTNASNIYNPAALPAIANARNAPQRNQENILTSYVLSDTLSLADEKILVTLGLRDQTVAQQTFNVANGVQTADYKESAISPLAGIVIKPFDHVSLYANHTKGLTRGAIVPIDGNNFSNQGQAITPYKSTQKEVGVKIDFGNITTVASVFEIERPNLETDPLTNSRGYIGEQRNRGLELAAYGVVKSGLRIMASAMLNDAKVKSASTPAIDGKNAIGVPDRTFNLGLDWDTSWVAGLSLNGRVINTSSGYYNGTNTLSVPGWTRVDIGARYTTLAAGKPMILRANIENLLAKDYWLQSNTFLTVGAPRTLVLSATVDF